MPQHLSNTDETIIKNISVLVGNSSFQTISETKILRPFADEVLEFFQDLSKNILRDKEAKKYPDIVTYGFWIRRTSLIQYRNRYQERLDDDIRICMGRGVVFHIAPSNVPINYMYSFTVGLLTGNINIVRISSKEFEQISIVNRILNETLKEHSEILPYIYFVKYERNKEINDYFSSIADVRVIWGGDATIAELRQSPLKARAREIAFADRYSLAVIDADSYMEREDKKSLALSFYNDTYLSDQNACTSPRIVIWLGNNVQEAKQEFWKYLYEMVSSQYPIQPIQAVDKLTNLLLTASETKCRLVKEYDNRMVRIELENLDADIMEHRGNSGFFYEYDCSDISKLEPLITDKCQTIGYEGDTKMFLPLLNLGISGVDRIVPIGKTMDFDFVWDGYDLFAQLTRNIVIV